MESVVIHFSQGTLHCFLVSSLLVLPRSSCKSSYLLFFRDSSGLLSLGHLSYVDLVMENLCCCCVSSTYLTNKKNILILELLGSSPTQHYIYVAAYRKKKALKLNKRLRKLKEGKERRQESILENTESEMKCITHPGVYSVTRRRCDFAECDNSSFSVTLVLCQMCSCPPILFRHALEAILGPLQ